MIPGTNATRQPVYKYNSNFAKVVRVPVLWVMTNSAGPPSTSSSFQLLPVPLRLKTGEDSCILAPGTLGTGEDSVILAYRTLGKSYVQDLGISAPGTLGTRCSKMTGTGES